MKAKHIYNLCYIFGLVMIFLAITEDQKINRIILDELHHKTNSQPPDTIIIVDTVVCTAQREIIDSDVVLEYIETIGILHPDIVLAQAILESGNLTSNIFLENNNMFGMKQAKSRPTLSIGENKNHAVYNSWQDCVLDYKIFQTKYYRDTTESYYSFLQRVGYAMSEGYINKLKAI